MVGVDYLLNVDMFLRLLSSSEGSVKVSMKPLQRFTKNQDILTHENIHFYQSARKRNKFRDRTLWWTFKGEQLCYKYFL